MNLRPVLGRIGALLSLGLFVLVVKLARPDITAALWEILMAAGLVLVIEIVFALRRPFHASFKVRSEGLVGAHDREWTTVPWDTIDGFMWVRRWIWFRRPRSRSPRTHGDVLCVRLHDGTQLRVTQDVLPRQLAITVDEQLRKAAVIGLVPPHVQIGELGDEHDGDFIARESEVWVQRRVALLRDLGLDVEADAAEVSHAFAAQAPGDSRLGDPDAIVDVPFARPHRQR